MAKLSKKEVAERINKNTRWLWTYIDNGQVVLNENQEIDDKDPQNAKFIGKWEARAMARGKKPQNTIKPEREVVLPSEIEKKEKVPEVSPEQLAILQRDADLEYEKLKFQVAELQGRVEKLTLSNQKTKGSFIAIDPVKTLMVQLSEAIFIECENEINDIVLQFGAKNQLSREEIAKIKQERIESMNSVRSRALVECKKGLRRLQNETIDNRLKNGNNTTSD